MLLSSLGEKGLIERLRQQLAQGGSRAGVVVDIGDDAAAFQLPGAEKLTLFTCDMLVEGIHFRREWTPPEKLGWKALAVNVSDIAAMGGRPTFALVSIALPGNTPVDFVDQIYSGLLKCAQEYGVVIAGGDTVGSQQGIVIDVSLLGEVDKERVVRRRGAQPGDVIAVTGPLGAAAAGLQILARQGASNIGARPGPDFPPPVMGEGQGGGATDLNPPQGGRRGLRASSPLDELTARLLEPKPRLAEGQALAATGLVTAMMDLSDGLGDDLPRLCQESKVGAKIFSEKIPIHPALAAACEQLNFNPFDLALRGGEDYELLFTCAPARLAAITAALEKLCAPVVIGEILPSASGLQVVRPDGSTSPLPEGFKHFTG